MPEETQEGIVNDDASADEAEGDFQDQVLAELEGAQRDAAKEILEAAGIEGGSLFDTGEIDELLGAESERPKAQSKAKQAKPKKEDGGVRFSNLKEAEAETRKLQSERDKLQARIEKLESGMDPEIAQAKAIIRDINSDPTLAAGLRTYFKTGKFSEESYPSGDEFIGDEFSMDDSTDYGAMTKEQIARMVDEQVNARLQQASDANARQVHFEAQRQALLEAYPHIDETEFEELIEFAKNPKGVTLTNLYKLKNLSREIEDRAKVLAERMFRSRGAGTVRPSVGGAAGGDTDVDEDPQTSILRDIVNAGRKSALLG